MWQASVDFVASDRLCDCHNKQGVKPCENDECHEVGAEQGCWRGGGDAQGWQSLFPSFPSRLAWCCGASARATTHLKNPTCALQITWDFKTRCSHEKKIVLASLPFCCGSFCQQEFGDFSSCMGSGNTCPSAVELARLEWAFPIATLNQGSLPAGKVGRCGGVQYARTSICTEQNGYARWVWSWPPPSPSPTRAAF